MPPTKLAHLVFQTNRLPPMRDWYCTVLDGHVIYENPHLFFSPTTTSTTGSPSSTSARWRPRDLSAGGDLRYRPPTSPGCTTSRSPSARWASCSTTTSGSPPGASARSAPSTTGRPRPCTTSTPRQPGRAADRQLRHRGGRAGLDALPRLRPEPDRRRVRARRPGPQVPGRRPGRRPRRPRLERGQVLHSDIFHDARAPATGGGRRAAALRGRGDPRGAVRAARPRRSASTRRRASGAPRRCSAT